MPRNSLGVYTVPPGTPAVSLTTISSSAYNAFLNDISAAITQSVATTGVSQMTGALVVNLASPTTIPAPSMSGVGVQIAAPANTISTLLLQAVGAPGRIVGQQASGTWGAPTATNGNTPLLQLTGYGYNGTAWTTSGAVRIDLDTSNPWTGTDNSSMIVFSTTPKTSTTIAEAMRLTANGVLSVGPNIVNIVDPGAGVSLQTQGAIYVGGAQGTNAIAQVVINQAGYGGLPTPLAGTLLQAGALSGTQSRIGLEASAAVGALNFRRAEGTWGSPTATASVSVIGQISGFGYANGAYTTTPNIAVNLSTNNAWSATDRSTYAAIYTTPSASTTLSEAARFQPSGGLSVGNSAFNAADPGQGVIAAQNAVQLPQGAPVHDNRVINGGFDVWQLGTSFSIPTSGVQYTADQWEGFTNTANPLVLTKATGPGYGSFNVMSFSIAAMPSGGGCQIFQPLEAAQIGDLDSQPVTASFTMATTQGGGSTLLGNLILQGNTAADNSTWSVAICNVAFTVPGGVPSRVVIPLTAAQTVGLKFGARLVLGFTQSGATNNVAGNIGAVQLAKGPVAQPWAPKGVAREIADCERFYEKSYDLGTVVGTVTPAGAAGFFLGGSGVGAGGFVTVLTPFKITKRVDPTITLYSTSNGASGSVTVGAAVSTAAGASAGQSGFPSIQNTSGSAWAVGNNINFHWTADARL